MSVNSHRHVQFPRGQHSKTSFNSGGSAAKETSYVAKVEKLSPESGGFAAGALSYFIMMKWNQIEKTFNIIMNR